MEAGKQAGESDEACLGREDAIEACRQGRLALLGWMPAIGGGMAMDGPDQRADAALGDAVLIREGVELVNEAFGMNPAQAVLTDIELAGVIADDDGVGQKAMHLDAAPQGALGRDQHRIRIDFERRDAEPIKMRGPGYMIGEESGRVLGEATDHRTGEGALAHIGQRLGIDDIITMARTQQFEEVAAALRFIKNGPAST